MNDKNTLEQLRVDFEAAAAAAENTRKAYLRARSRAQAAEGLETACEEGTCCASFARNFVHPSVESGDWELLSFDLDWSERAGRERLDFEVQIEGARFQITVEHSGFAE
jgi:hypothetical protein